MKEAKRVAAFTASSRTGQTIILKDGRTLGYGEWGYRAGRVIFYFHGYPGSHYEAALADEPATRAGVRLIGLDRPGMGLSSFKPGRRLLDWPDDVMEAADALDIERFAVIGMSGGGPYAAACACKIPGRLAACGIVAGLAPFKHGFKDMMFQIRLVFWAAKHAPWLYDRLLTLILNLHRQNPEKMEKILLAGMYRLPEPDRRYLEKPEIRAAIVRYTEEAFRQGTDGVLYEGDLYTRPWGFEPEDIAFDKISLWHGDLDRSVPVSMGRAMAQRLPNVRATFYPNDGHLSIALNHMDEILGMSLSDRFASG
ncbi:MAG: alpha/beta fold hydrolase, partial [Chloroflexota bacterium]